MQVGHGDASGELRAEISNRSQYARARGRRAFRPRVSRARDQSRRCTCTRTHLGVVGVLGRHRRRGFRRELVEFLGRHALEHAHAHFLRDNRLRDERTSDRSSVRECTHFISSVRALARARATRRLSKVGTQSPRAPTFAKIQKRRAVHRRSPSRARSTSPRARERRREIVRQ